VKHTAPAAPPHDESRVHTHTSNSPITISLPSPPVEKTRPRARSCFHAGRSLARWAPAASSRAREGDGGVVVTVSKQITVSLGADRIGDHLGLILHIGAGRRRRWRWWWWRAFYLVRMRNVYPTLRTLSNDGSLTGF
jgi:hypothetical protein